MRCSGRFIGPPLLMLLLCGAPCGTSDKTFSQPQCPKGTHQCGYGCLANSAKCCTADGEWADGTFQCANSLGTCTRNEGGQCGSSRYCCSADGFSTMGSVDCTGDEVVCNTNCIKRGATCCSLTSPGSCGPVGGLETSSNTDSAGGCGGPSAASGSCSTDADCSGFGSRHCNPRNGARCGPDGLCHCCLAVCSGSSCQCMACGSGCGSSQVTCLNGTCAFNVGGKTSD